MTFSRQIILILVSTLITSCSSLLKYDSESIHTDYTSSDLKVGFQKDFGPGKGYIREFIPKNESIDNWQHLTTIQFLEGEQSSPQKVMRSLEESMKKKCDTTWEILSQGKNDILYEWSIRPCQAGVDQHEIARLIQGNDGLHRIAYAEKQLTMNPEARQKWLTIIKNAYVTKGGKPIVLNGSP